jgi:membrane-bound lytic murein transglycosylase B
MTKVVFRDMIAPITLPQRIRMRQFALAALFTSLIATPSFAARCGGDFNGFVAAISQEASAAGVSQAVISEAFNGVTTTRRC